MSDGAHRVGRLQWRIALGSREEADGCGRGSDGAPPAIGPALARAFDGMGPATMCFHRPLEAAVAWRAPRPGAPLPDASGADRTPGRAARDAGRRRSRAALDRQLPLESTSSTSNRAPPWYADRRRPARPCQRAGDASRPNGCAAPPTAPRRRPVPVPRLSLRPTRMAVGVHSVCRSAPSGERLGRCDRAHRGAPNSASPARTSGTGGGLIAVGSPRANGRTAAIAVKPPSRQTRCGCSIDWPCRRDWRSRSTVRGSRRISGGTRCGRTTTIDPPRGRRCGCPRSTPASWC